MDIRHTLCVYIIHKPSSTSSRWLVYLSLLLLFSALYAAVCANHGRKKRRPSPLQLVSSRPAISLPVIVHAGQFTDGDDDRKFGGFMDVPLENQGAGEAEEP
jgi:hypothetical protein